MMLHARYASMGAMHKKAATPTARPEDNGKCRDESTRDEQHDPWNPPYPPRDPGQTIDADIAAHTISVKKWIKKTGAILANPRPNNIIIQDPTPQWINYVFFDTLHLLEPILKMDSVQYFLRFLNQNIDVMSWGYIITPEALNQIVVHNAMRCAKVVLVGEYPELHGFRAYPNCMTQYGFSVLHRAAEIFSVDMIGLLLRHGASANLRTAGALVIEGLLPLHVAVENTCLHKYLEDCLYPNQENRDGCQADINYILKLIHILCLPEMKIFLDTVRLLSKHTDNLLDEICKYIIDGKIVQTAVLLLAAQEQIRGVSSRKRGGNSKPDGFGTIINLVLGKITAIKLEICQKELEMESLDEQKKRFDNTLTLVYVISQAGEALDSYVRSPPKVPYVLQVPHVEVLERVSLILKDHGFCSTGDGLDIGNLCPYEDVLSNEELPHKLEEMSRIKAGVEVPCLRNGMVKVKKEPRGWELKLARRSFFPCWRSVLASAFPVKLYRFEELQATLTKSTGEASATMGRNPLVKASYQPRRLFGTVALTLLKVLRKA